jgi:hypothetical protein
MKKGIIALAVASLGIASPALANHDQNLDVPFASRGECEAVSAELDNEAREFLLALYPNLFDNTGEVRSFTQRAFTCEQVNGLWYIKDHRFEVLASDWWQRRK